MKLLPIDNYGHCWHNTQARVDRLEKGHQATKKHVSLSATHRLQRGALPVVAVNVVGMTPAPAFPAGAVAISTQHCY